MIYNQWYVVLESKEIPKKRPIAVKRLNEKMVFWRDDNGNICCIADKCCHRGASLGIGQIINNHLKCPFHGFQYDKTGKVKVIPANGNLSSVPEYYSVKSYKVKELYGLIWLWWGDCRNEYPEISFFSELKEGFSYSTFKSHWSVHYSRAIENQLDVVHLPFVHKTTIGKGNKTLVNGPVVEIDGQMLKFYVSNTVDDGKTRQLKAEEIDDYTKLPTLKLYFPNIWENIISNKVKVFASFAPIDEENTMIYIRFYQKLITVPIIRTLFNFAGIMFSKIILNQDKRVVITQIPKKSGLKMDEKLIAGDLPIVKYREFKEEIMKSK